MHISLFSSGLNFVMMVIKTNMFLAWCGHILPSGGPKINEDSLNGRFLGLISKVNVESFLRFGFDLVMIVFIKDWNYFHGLAHFSLLLGSKFLKQPNWMFGDFSRAANHLSV